MELASAVRIIGIQERASHTHTTSNGPFERINRFFDGVVADAQFQTDGLQSMTPCQVVGRSIALGAAFRIGHFRASEILSELGLPWSAAPHGGPRETVLKRLHRVLGKH